jgi:hypothetical protein
LGEPPERRSWVYFLLESLRQKEKTLTPLY